MESISKGILTQHLAGIVPIGGQPLEFNMPWHDSLMPVAPNFLAIERSIYECALAGCETIWVVGHYGTQPIIKKRIGDFVFDPNSFDFNGKKGPNRTLPIYYVPINPKDKERRDSLAWSVLYGAHSAYSISKFLTKWIIPEKFFCSFPYGIADPFTIRDNRKTISTNKKTIFTYKNKSIKDNIHLSFTFDEKDYFACRDIARQRDLGIWLEHRIDASQYDLAKVFKGLDHADANVIELPWFYDISTWQGYKEFLNSEHSKIFKRPNKFFTKFKKRKFVYEQDSGEEIQQSESAFKRENESST
jgi:hypothetical protein